MEPVNGENGAVFLDDIVVNYFHEHWQNSRIKVLGQYAVKAKCYPGGQPMKIGLFTDGLMHLGFTEALAKAASLGVQAIEIGTGNFSPAPHCDLNRLLNSSAAREEFLQAIGSCNLEFAALNCSGNPLHPNDDLALWVAAAPARCRAAGLVHALPCGRDAVAQLSVDA